MEAVESGMALRNVGSVQPVSRFVPAVSDSGSHPIGLITLDVKSAGARSAGNPHATCDVAGVGDGITDIPKRARRWKRRKQPRNSLRIYAPALDPTGICNNNVGQSDVLSTVAVGYRSALGRCDYLTNCARDFQTVRRWRVSPVRLRSEPPGDRLDPPQVIVRPSAA